MIETELPDRVLDFIRRKSKEIEYGTIRIELSMSGFVDVVIEARTRFALPERNNKRGYKNPRPVAVVKLVDKETLKKNNDGS